MTPEPVHLHLQQQHCHHVAGLSPAPRVAISDGRHNTDHLSWSQLTVPLQVPAPLATPSASAQQVWDVDRLIRARNPGAVFTTTERDTQVTWQTLRSADNRV